MIPDESGPALPELPRGWPRSRYLPTPSGRDEFSTYFPSGDMAPPQSAKCPMNNGRNVSLPAWISKTPNSTASPILADPEMRILPEAPNSSNPSCARYHALASWFELDFRYAIPRAEPLAIDRFTVWAELKHTKIAWQPVGQRDRHFGPVIGNRMSLSALGR